MVEEENKSQTEKTENVLLIKWCITRKQATCETMKPNYRECVWQHLRGNWARVCSVYVGERILYGMYVTLRGRGKQGESLDDLLPLIS